jgi:Holliday junction resolvase RusA-like endonuclease
VVEVELRPSLALWVEGQPIQQGSKTAFVVKGRAVMTDQNAKTLKPWRAKVTATARAAVESAQPGGFGDVPCTVAMRFVFERPASSRREWPAVYPDIDKLARAALDGLTDAAVFRDDSRVVELLLTKVYGEREGVEIYVAPVAGKGVLAELFESGWRAMRDRLASMMKGS